MKTVTNRVEDEERSDWGSRVGFSGVIEREYEEMRKVLQGRADVVEIEREETVIATRRRR